MGDSQLLDLGSYMDGGIFNREREQRTDLRGGGGDRELVYVC